MDESIPQLSRLERLYHEYLVDQDSSAFLRKVSQSYTTGTLERLVQHGPRLARRGAALSLGHLGDYGSNHVLGCALQDEDRGVRLLAENAIRSVWCRQGTEDQQQELGAIMRLNSGKHYQAAIDRAGTLVNDASDLAEGWNQRAIAYYGLGRYYESIENCRQAVELNPYHFGAVAGMGQCYMQLGNQLWALESFRRALALNPNLEGIRANIAMLETKLKK